jgi:hypothetical protein
MKILKYIFLFAAIIILASFLTRTFSLDTDKSFNNGRFKITNKYVYFFEFRPSEQEVVELFYFIDFFELDGKVYMVGNRKGFSLDKGPILLVNYAGGNSKICFKQKESVDKTRQDFEYVFKDKTDSAFPYISIRLASETNSLSHSTNSNSSDLIFYIFSPQTGCIDVFYNLQGLSEQNKTIFEKLASTTLESKLFKY